MNNDQQEVADQSLRKILEMREYFQKQQSRQERDQFIFQSRARTQNTIVDQLCEDAVNSASNFQWDLCDSKLLDLIQYLKQTQYIENEQLANLKIILQHLTEDKARIMEKILRLFSFNATRRYFSPMLLQQIDKFYLIDSVLNAYLIFMNKLIITDPIILQEQCLIQEIEETHKYACMTQKNLDAWFDIIVSLCYKEGYTYNFKHLLPVLLLYKKSRSDIFLKFILTFVNTDGQEEAAVKYLFRYSESVDFILEIMFDGNLEAIQVVSRISEVFKSFQQKKFSKDGTEKIVDAGVLGVLEKLYYIHEDQRKQVLSKSTYILTNMFLWSQRLVVQIMESEILKIILQSKSIDLDYNGRLSYLFLITEVVPHASQREIEYIALKTGFVGIAADCIRDMTHLNLPQLAINCLYEIYKNLSEEKQHLYNELCNINEIPQLIQLKYQVELFTS